MTYNDKPIYIKLNKQLVVWCKKCSEKKNGNFDISLCDNSQINKIDLLNKIQKELMNRILTNEKYKSMILESNLYNFISFDNVFKILQQEHEEIGCFDKNNNRISLDRIKSNSIVNVIIQLQHIWKRKKWYGYTYKLIQIQLEDYVFNQSLFDGIVKQRNTFPIQETHKTIPVAPSLVNFKIAKPSLHDILNMRDKILKQKM